WRKRTLRSRLGRADLSFSAGPPREAALRRGRLGEGCWNAHSRVASSGLNTRAGRVSLGLPEESLNHPLTILASSSPNDLSAQFATAARNLERPPPRPD